MYRKRLHLVELLIAWSSIYHLLLKLVKIVKIIQCDSLASFKCLLKNVDLSTYLKCY